MNLGVCSLLLLVERVEGEGGVEGEGVAAPLCKWYL